MVTLTRLNNNKIVVNAELIEFIEASPDTLVTLTTGQKIMVREPVNEVVNRVIAYKQDIHTHSLTDRG
jgi:flagellar protein FlbD